MSKYFLVLLIYFFFRVNAGTAQDTLAHTVPIFSMEGDSVTFYDRLDAILKSSEIKYANTDSSFSWMAGSWAIDAKGFAKTGFHGKKEFSWKEPIAEYWVDENHAIFIVSKDSITLASRSARKRMLLPPQVILQYDNYGKVWVLQPGYNNRYDWGSLIANGWEGNKIIFTGTISLAGLKVNEKETWTKISANEFHIQYEERLLNGSWFVIEENIFTRVK